MYKIIKNCFLVITFITTTMAYVENIATTTDDKEYITTNILDLKLHDLQKDCNSWAITKAAIFPSNDQSNGYSFDIFYTVFDEDKDDYYDANLHLTGCEYPILEQAINILYNKNNFHDIIIAEHLTGKTD